METLVPKALSTINATFQIKNSSKRGGNTNPAFANLQTESQIFYKFWPYLSRMTSEVQYLTKNSKMIEILARQKLFLSSNGFQNITDLYLPILPLTKNALNYLHGHFPLANTPHEIYLDLIKLNIKFTSLTPAVLRAKLRTDAREHSSFLAQNQNILLSLLLYASADFQPPPGIAEDGNKTIPLYKELAGTYTRTRYVQCISVQPNCYAYQELNK